MPDRPVFEIVNPSDPYTLRGERDVARAACLLLGKGYFALRDAAGELVLPLFVLGNSFEEWAKEEGFDLPGILKDRAMEVVATLDSVLIGGFRERREVEAATARMAPGDAEAWLAERHEARRSSLNDIGARAKALARRIQGTQQKDQERHIAERMAVVTDSGVSFAEPDGE